MLGNFRGYGKWTVFKVWLPLVNQHLWIRLRKDCGNGGGNHRERNEFLSIQFSLAGQHQHGTSIWYKLHRRDQFEIKVKKDFDFLRVISKVCWKKVIRQNLRSAKSNLSADKRSRFVQQTRRPSLRLVCFLKSKSSAEEWVFYFYFKQVDRDQRSVLFFVF